MKIERRKSKQIRVGGVPIGGAADISIQSMTTTDTRDAGATQAQIVRLTEAGCEIVRVAVPDMAAARAFAAIREASGIPVVADIHFDYRLAIEAVAAGADKIRINPGNIGGEERVHAVVKACQSRGVPIRIGVNSGSIEKEMLAKYGNSPEAMVESVLSHVQLLERFDFTDICLSVKAPDVQGTMAAYRLLAQHCDYPFHLGVTHAGTLRQGTLKAAAGIGGLLAMGIGDTLRVTLTADPVEEVLAAREILKAVGVRHEGIELISCPTCGRCRVDLIPIAEQVERGFASIRTHLRVAVMGCEVNGPGEARDADLGVACGAGVGLLFSKGQVLRKVPQESIVPELLELANRMAADMENSADE